MHEFRIRPGAWTQLKCVPSHPTETHIDQIVTDIFSRSLLFLLCLVVSRKIVNELC